MKYSPVELQMMAVFTLDARRKKDPRYDRLLNEVSDRTGLSKKQVEKNIIALVKGHG